MAIRTKYADVFRVVVFPIAVDVLDLERYESRVAIAFTPTAQLASLSDGFDDVTPDRSVKVESRRQFACAPQ
jgi:hypothetical protein